MTTTQALLFALLGAVLVGGVLLAWYVSERQHTRIPPTDAPVVPPEVTTVLSVLRSSAGCARCSAFTPARSA